MTLDDIEGIGIYTVEVEDFKEIRLVLMDLRVRNFKKVSRWMEADSVTRGAQSSDFSNRDAKD